MKSIPHLVAAALFGTVFGASPVFAAKGDPVAGQTKAVVCQACHGVDGNATTDQQYPRLAGQYPDYLARALQEYKSGERSNPIMAGFAATLSEQDMLDLAAHFASLSPSKLSDLSEHLKDARLPDE